MKKIFSIILVLILLITPFSISFASAEGADSDIENYDSAAVFLEKFVTDCDDRLAGTEGEKEAAEFIAGEFQKLAEEGSGYVPYNASAETLAGKFYQKFTFIDNEVSKESQNIIMTKPAKNGSEKTVIIGAHYDNAYQRPEGTDKNDYKMQGAYDNGTGIAVMMDLANRLKDADLVDFNVTFIAFGAEEYLLKGSEYYVSKLSKEELEDILIMFNLDVIGAGDKLYLYCDEVKTEHEEFLFNVAKSGGINLNKAPLDKHIVLYELNGMPYIHTGLMSDNLSFLTKGVLTAFFFTYNWEYGLSESDKNPTMIHNTNDNIDFLKEHYAATYEKFMDDVSDIIYISLAETENFEETMTLSLANKFNYTPFLNKTMVMITAAVILTLAGILVVLTYVSLNKKKMKESPEIINPAEENDKSVFGKDFEDDIFG